MERHIPEFKPKIVLAIAAHPDDLEFGTAGSAAAWVNAGAEVHYLICTDGSKGSDDPDVTGLQLTELRRQEQRAAAKILGVSSVTFLNHPDGLTVADAQLKKDIVQVIRKLKPDTVVAQDPSMVYNADFGVINHNDHRNVGLAAMDAVYPLARDHLSFPELAGQGFVPHKVTDLLFMGNFDDRSNCYIDISHTYETKLKALAAHVSQVDMNEVGGFIDHFTKEAGKQGGFKRAEAFVRLHMFI